MPGQRLKKDQTKRNYWTVGPINRVYMQIAKNKMGVFYFSGLLSR